MHDIQCNGQGAVLVACCAHGSASALGQIGSDEWPQLDS